MKRTVRLTALMIALLFAASAGSALPPPYGQTFCGEPCWNEGFSKGCVYWGGGVLWKVPCTCTGGTWLCD